MTAKHGILMSLVTILLSSFFLIEHYQNKIQASNISATELLVLDTIAISTQPEDRLEKLLKVENKVAWLHLAKIYAKDNADVAYQLGQYYLTIGQEHSAVLWWQEAIRQSHHGARIRLAKYYFSIRQYNKSKKLIMPISDDDSALLLLYELALQQGNLHFISTHQARLASLSNTDFYQELFNFSVFEPVITDVNSQCSIDVQLFATNLKGLRHAEQLSSAFQNHKLSAFICLQKPRYISSKQLKCDHMLNEKISCSASVWANRSDISSRYIGLVVEQGGANVDNGIMYIDQQDNVDVLAHELSHFVGFVDEYPIPKQHPSCQQRQSTAFSHNVVTLKKHYVGSKIDIRKRILAQIPWSFLIKSSTPILAESAKGWHLTTPQAFNEEVGVFSAKTCDNNSKVQAFKPYSQRTQLEYFELGFPQVYIDILADLPVQFLMPSYHFNVSRDLAEQGDYSRAREILRATLFR